MSRFCLVGGFTPSEKYWSIGRIIPNIWENKTCSSHHQPVTKLIKLAEKEPSIRTISSVNGQKFIDQGATPKASSRSRVAVRPALPKMAGKSPLFVELASWKKHTRHGSDQQLATILNGLFRVSFPM